MPKFLSFALLVIPVSLVAAVCDEYSYPAESTKASKLTPNTFHKLCPSTSSLGVPICGDGTAFSFYYTSPVQRRSSNKILIEFMGGGACWDANTCDYNADRLTFPYQFDNFLGLSCSEINRGIANGDNGDQDVPINMLCAQQLGEVDFREFHNLIVPYCTQDTHMGSNTITYEDGTTVHHQGGRNMLSVLEWVYANFPHPEQVVLTGCSAGGTALTVAYDLVHHHYNSWTKGKNTAVSVMSDSPVYLTPSYFLEEGMPNWNVQPIMNRIRFNYNKYKESEDFSYKLGKHVLKRGSKKDTLGMITHTQDPVSLAYFQRMSTSYGDDDDDGRRLEEDDNDYSEWWSLLSSSITRVTDTCPNCKSYIINGEGHCSFGLYYALMEGGDDFVEWASNLLYAPTHKRHTGQGWFWISALVGITLVAATVWHQRKMETNGGGTNPHEVVHAQQTSTSLKGSLLAGLQRSAAFIARYAKNAPISIAYGAAVTIYFVRMMTWDGLELFFYNPSLGPSATTLSAFGINNPTLAVYHHQLLRVLVTSTFLCSGFVTYVMLMYSLYYHIQRLEKIMRLMAQPKTGRIHFASSNFLQVSALIAIGSNLLYAMLANGASCSSMALILGLQAFSCTMHRYHKQVDFPNPLWSTICTFVFTSLLLPYNSWLMMLCAMVMGAGLAVWVYSVYVPVFQQAKNNEGEAPSTTDYTETQDYTSTVDYTVETDYASYTETDGTYSEDFTNPSKKPSMPTKRDPSTLTLLRKNRPLQAIVAFLCLLLLCLVARVRRPNRMYEQPFLTGCELVYTAHLDEIAGSFLADQFAPDNGERKRRLDDGDQEEEEEYEDNRESHMCAQFCVPHLVSRVFLWGANVYTGFGVERGFCEDIGYSQHIADKTYSYQSYSIDVELYYDDNYSSQDNDDGGDED